MKSNKKFKTLQIDELVHDNVVRYCKNNGLKISFFVEKLLTNTIRNLDETIISKET
jgi:hypothetical protein